MFEPGRPTETKELREAELRTSAFPSRAWERVLIFLKSEIPIPKFSFGERSMLIRRFMVAGLFLAFCSFSLAAVAAGEPAGSEVEKASGAAPAAPADVKPGAAPTREDPLS